MSYIYSKVKVFFLITIMFSLIIAHVCNSATAETVIKSIPMSGEKPDSFNAMEFSLDTHHQSGNYYYRSWGCSIWNRGKHNR